VVFQKNANRPSTITSDTLYTIFLLLAPLAGLARTVNDIQREPKNRIPDHPQRRPLGVVIDLITPTDAAAISVGVDVTIPHISSSLSKKSYPSIPFDHKDSLGQHPLEIAWTHLPIFPGR
jgi:hypothetical protein